MGATQSKSAVSNINNQIIVNKTSLDLLNEQNNSVIANTIMKSAQNNSASIIQNQSVTIRNIKAKGDIDIGKITQNQSAMLNFTGLNATDIKNDASTTLLTQMMNNIKNSTDTTTLAQMIANASSATNVGALSMPGWASSDSSVINAASTNIQNTTDYKLRNIVSNSIANNFTSDNVSNCIASVSNSQDVTVADIVSTDGKFLFSGVDQTQAATTIANCVNQSGVTNKIINDLSNVFGITIDESKKTETTTTQDGTTTSTTETQGLLDSFSSLITSVFGSLFSGYATIIGISFVSSLCCCCCILLMIMALSMNFS